VVFILNMVGLEELLKRPTAESTRVGVHLYLHGILHQLLKCTLAACDTPPLDLEALQVTPKEGPFDL
jgi:hypothetical protein